MALVLALEPNPAQARILRQLVARVPGAELILVDTKDAALAALDHRVPSLILTSPLLAPADEADLTARLRVLPNGDRVQTLCTPLFAATSARVTRKTGLLAGWHRRAPEHAPADEATLFAKAIATYLQDAIPMARLKPGSTPTTAWLKPGSRPTTVPLKPGSRPTTVPLKPGTASPPARRAPRPQPGVTLHKISIAARGAAQDLVRRSSPIARRAGVHLRRSIMWTGVAATRACRASRVGVAEAWGSPRVRSLCVAVFVALTAGTTPRSSGAHVPPAVVDLRANALDTDIFVDGKPRGRAPKMLLLTPGAHVLIARRQGATHTIPLNVTSGARILEYIAWPPPRPAGKLHITTSPAGARVTIDGRVRGETPLAVDHLSPGRHKVFLESRAGSVRAVATVKNGGTTNLDVPIFAGWIAVFAPVQVQIHENGRLLGTSESGRIMIAPGRHVLRLTNSDLGYESTRVVEVTPGNIAAISITTVP